jgi:hypothetical protein
MLNTKPIIPPNLNILMIKIHFTIEDDFCESFYIVLIWYLFKGSCIPSFFNKSSSSIFLKDLVFFPFNSIHLHSCINLTIPSVLIFHDNPYLQDTWKPKLSQYHSADKPPCTLFYLFFFLVVVINIFNEVLSFVLPLQSFVCFFRYKVMAV